MTEKLKQDLKEQMKFLSKDSQGAINSFDWVKVSEEIAKNHSFTEDDTNMLQANIGLVLVGLEDQDELVVNIEEDINVSKDHAQKISEEIIQQILRPIAENLSENIKRDLKNRNTTWQQDLDFIISGGDYTAFIKEPEKEVQGMSQDTSKEETLSASIKINDLKDKFTI